MQESLKRVDGKRVALTRGGHPSLTYFWWIAEDLSRSPIILHDIVPLQPTLDGYHNAYGYMC